LRLFLKEKGLWNEEVENKLNEEAQKEIDQAVRESEAVPTPEMEDIFGYVFAEMTPPLKEQMAYLKSTL